MLGYHNLPAETANGCATAVLHGNISAAIRRVSTGSWAAPTTCSCRAARTSFRVKSRPCCSATRPCIGTGDGLRARPERPGALRLIVPLDQAAVTQDEIKQFALANVPPTSSRGGVFSSSFRSRERTEGGQRRSCGGWSPLAGDVYERLPFIPMRYFRSVRWSGRTCRRMHPFPRVPVNGRRTCTRRSALLQSRAGLALVVLVSALERSCPRHPGVLAKWYCWHRASLLLAVFDTCAISTVSAVRYVAIPDSVITARYICLTGESWA